MLVPCSDGRCWLTPVGHRRMLSALVNTCGLYNTDSLRQGHRGSMGKRHTGVACSGLITAGLMLGMSQAQAQALEPWNRKSTRLNSSHVRISYAVFCLKKKKKRRAYYYYEQ